MRIISTETLPKPLQTLVSGWHPLCCLGCAKQLQGLCRADDVQVEFIMLDPYQRITLQHNNEARPLVVAHMPRLIGCSHGI